MAENEMVRLNIIMDSMDMNLSKVWKIVKDREAWHTAVHGVAKSWKEIKKSASTKCCRE